MAKQNTSANGNSEKLASQISKLNEKLNEISETKISVGCLRNAAESPESGTFPEFFNTLIGAMARTNSRGPCWDQPLIMRYTYFQDLCEILKRDFPELRQEMSQKLEHQTFEMADLRDLCGVVLDGLDEQAEAVRKELDGLVYGMARSVLLEAA